MESKIKLLIFVLILCLLVANVSAMDEVLKPAKLNQNYTILQTCASCTYVNVTISNVDGIIVSNEAMVNNDSGVWVYYIVPTILSRYDVTGQGDLEGTDTSFATYFEVTPSGKVSSTGDSIIYFLFCIILFGIISILFFFIFTMPSSNERDERGFENKIIKMKYIRMVFIFLTYPLIILLLNFLNGLAVNFTALTVFSGIIGFLFETMLRLAWPFTIIIIAWIIVMLVHDTNVKKQLNKVINLGNVVWE